MDFTPVTEAVRLAALLAALGSQPAPPPPPPAPRPVVAAPAPSTPPTTSPAPPYDTVFPGDHPTAPGQPCDPIDECPPGGHIDLPAPAPTVEVTDLELVAIVTNNDGTQVAVNRAGLDAYEWSHVVPLDPPELHIELPVPSGEAEEAGEDIVRALAIETDGVTTSVPGSGVVVTINGEQVTP